MKDRFRRDAIIYEHQRLTFAGIAGQMMNQELSAAGQLIRSKCLETEVSPIQLQPRRDFLALFGFSPPLDITLDQYSPLENSIVGYALDRTRLIERMQDIADIIGFTPHSKQDLAIAETWRREFEIEKQTYFWCEQISEHLGQPLERIFGLVRYTSFLTQYMGKDEKIAQEIASQRFGISLS